MLKNSRPGFAYLDSVLRWDGKNAFTLHTMTALMRELGDPQNKVRAVHVGGTNGKGSVAAFTASMLQAAGQTVGLNTSPHLTNVTERCIINGSPCTEELFDEALVLVRDAAQASQLTPSFFEVVTAASFVEFARRKLNWMVIEVGLGGRLDATNSIERSALTSIVTVGLEHTNILGKTLSAIAREKAGILRSGVPLVCGPMAVEARETIRSCANAIGAPAEFLGGEFTMDKVNLAGGETLNLSELQLPLLGGHQVANAAVASRVGALLGLSKESIVRGLRSARWPGRMELLRGAGSIEKNAEGRTFLLDAAHNPDGIEVLGDFVVSGLETGQPFSNVDEVRLIISILDRKDWRLMLDKLRRMRDKLSLLFEQKAHFVFTRSEHPHCVDPQELAEYLGDGKVFTNSREAFEDVVTCSLPTSLIIVTGSIFLLGELRPLITSAQFQTTLL